LLLCCPACKTIPYFDVYTPHHFKELTECIKEVERIEATINSKKKAGLMMNEEKEEEEQEKIPATLDSFL
jgi:hypothetical protein